MQFATATNSPSCSYPASPGWGHPHAKLMYVASKSKLALNSARKLSPPSSASTNVYTVTLVLPGGKEATFRAGSSKSVLDIASYAGIHLPASCKQGACTACCAKVVSGQVSQKGQKCIPPALAKEGYVALCCSTPRSDVKLLTHQGVAVRKWKSEHGC